MSSLPLLQDSYDNNKNPLGQGDCVIGRLLELVAVRLPSPFTQTSGRYKKLSPRSVSFIATRGGSPKLLHSPVVMPDKFFQDFNK